MLFSGKCGYSTCPSSASSFRLSMIVWYAEFIPRPARKLITRRLTPIACKYKPINIGKLLLFRGAKADAIIEKNHQKDEKLNLKPRGKIALDLQTET